MIGIDMKETKELEIEGATFVIGRLPATSFVSAVGALAADKGNPKGLRTMMGAVRSWRGIEGIECSPRPDIRLEQIESFPYHVVARLLAEIQSFHFPTPGIETD